MSICIICREHPAEVPDRNSQSLRPVKRVCRACHAARLRSDLKHIVAEAKVDAERCYRRLSTTPRHQS